MNELTFYGYKVGFNKVALTRLLRERADLSLSEAKCIIDEVLENKTVHLNIASEENAEHILSNATQLGALVELKKHLH